MTGRIIEKIKKIEALIERAGTEGERVSAINAKNRLEKAKSKKELEYSLRTPDRWHKQLLVAICRKHGYKPFRYHRQKYTTVMVRISTEFLNNVLWKEYQEYSEMLTSLVNEITYDLISKIHKIEDEIVISGSIE
jgi:hypothetical protein